MSKRPAMAPMPENFGTKPTLDSAAYTHLLVRTTANGTELGSPEMHTSEDGAKASASLWLRGAGGRSITDGLALYRCELVQALK